jgi:pimeloyl-ACP methyl ester carboxylesterase
MARTVMLIHGMFLNPKSWEPWRRFFERAGFDCIAPAWPLHEGGPATLRRNVPKGLGELSLESIVSSMETAAAQYEDVILVGHSVGG